jgi:hypothetical protein
MAIELIQGAIHWISEDFLNLGVLRGVPDLSDTLWIAQATSTDLFSSIGQAWDNFIRTGQVWALIIGFFLGYIFRSITSY